MGAGLQAPGPSSSFLLGTLAGSWMAGKAGGTWTGTLMGCQCCWTWRYPLTLQCCPPTLEFLKSEGSSVSPCWRVLSIWIGLMLANMIALPAVFWFKFTRQSRPWTHHLAGVCLSWRSSLSHYKWLVLWAKSSHWSHATSCGPQAKRLFQKMTEFVFLQAQNWER